MKKKLEFEVSVFVKDSDKDEEIMEEVLKLIQKKFKDAKIAWYQRGL